MKSKGLKQSQKHEARLAKVFSGEVQAASGALWSRKGDVRTDDLLIEHKYTGKASFTVKAAVLEKIVKEAILDSRMPVLGVSLNDVNYVILDEQDFLELRQNHLEHKQCMKKTLAPSHGDTKESAEE